VLSYFEDAHQLAAYADANQDKFCEADFGGRLFVDPMNWDLLRRECNALFSKYAWKADLGTFDTAIVASVKLAGGTRFLSFDAKARALASAEGIGVFPALDLRLELSVNSVEVPPTARSSAYA
jgi:hypothetical protein